MHFMIISIIPQLLKIDKKERNAFEFINKNVNYRCCAILSSFGN